MPCMLDLVASHASQCVSSLVADYGFLEGLDRLWCDAGADRVGRLCVAWHKVRLYLTGSVLHFPSLYCLVHGLGDKRAFSAV